MSTDVHKYVQSCKECAQRNVPPHMRVRPPVVPDVVPKLFERVAVDIQGEFTPSKNGNKALVTFIDIHSRWIEGFAIKNCSALTVAKLFVTQIILRYGPVRSLISDRANAFIGQVIKETCKLFRIQKIDIAAYHPQSNATLERVHRFYADSLSKYINKKHDDWDEYFPFIQWAYRTSVQSTTGETPYKLVYGRDSPELVDLAFLPPTPRLKKEAKEWKDILVTRIRQQQDAQIKMQTRAREALLAASKHRFKEPRSFKVGDQVMIRNHIKETEEDQRLTHKWQPKFLGPYVVREQQGATTYLVEHMADAADKRVYSVDDIKPYYPRTLTPPNVDLDSLPITGESHDWNALDLDENEIDKIEGRRDITSGGRHRNQYEYLVSFKHLDGHKEWIRESDIHAPALLSKFNDELAANEKEARMYKTTRSGKIKIPRFS